MGPYGVGNRMKLKYTRAMLNAALDGDLDNVQYVTDERFGFSIPTECPDVPKELLQPIQTWSDTQSYNEAADSLADMFVIISSSMKPGYQKQSTLHLPNRW